MNETAKVDDKLLWAFAVDATKPLQESRSRNKRATKPKYKLHRYYVTVCSPKLRQFGVRAGMTYDEAKRLVPNMHIFVYNR
jgi:nucleotidyltransferase/DNA polymerase involved in DNA repair